MRILTLCFLLIGITFVFGQNPHDNPCTAKFINSSGQSGFELFDNIGSTYTQIEEPGCYDTAYQDVWFVTSVPLSGMIEISTLEGSLSDMFFSVYTGEHCDTDSLTLVECSDNNSPLSLYFPPIGMPTVSLSDRTPGEVLYIRVYDAHAPSIFGNPANPAEEGSFYMKISDPYDELMLTFFGECDNSIVGGNECSSATSLCTLDNLCGTTQGFTPNYWTSLGSTFAGSIENNAFFTFTPNDDTLELFTNVSGPQQELLQLMFFTLDSCEAVPENDTTVFADFGLDTLVIVDLIVGQEYYLMIDGWAGNHLDYQINTLENESFGYNLIGNDSICQNDTSLLFTTGIYSDSTNWSGSGLAYLDFISNDSAYFIGADPGDYQLFVELSGVSGLCGVSQDTLVITVFDNSTGSGTTFSESPNCSNFADTIVLEAPASNFHIWTNVLTGEISMADSIWFVNNMSQQFVLTEVLSNSCVFYDTIHIDLQDLISNFQVTPTSGNAPLSVDITDLSSGRNRNIWVYGDSPSDTVSIATNTQQAQFNHVYSNAGTYSLCLTVDSSQVCSETVCTDIYVHCNDPIVADNPILDTLYFNCPINSLPIPTASHSCGTYFGESDMLFPFDSEGVSEVIWTYTDTSGNSIQQNQFVVYRGLSDTILKVNEYLVSLQDTVDYQWLEVNLGVYSMISGETNQYFNPTNTGYYAVEVSYNGCVDTSNYLYHSACNEIELEIDSLVQCYNSFPAYIEVSAQGGTPPYSYLWDDGFTSNSRLIGACSVWNLEVTDSEGCSDDRYFYFFDIDTSQITVPIDTFFSDVMDICVPFNFQSVSIYDYYYNSQNEFIVSWIFEDQIGNSYIADVNYGVGVSFSQLGYYEFVLVIDCQDGGDNSKSVEFYSQGTFVNQGSLSSKSHIVEEDFNLFPNPFSGIVTLDVPENFVGGEVQIFSTDNKIVYIGSVDSEVSKLQPIMNSGIYFIVIKNNGIVLRRKIVKID